ncbi:bile acid:sodium symporter [Endozoicomonas sp. OPT23]|uniref:bile acid:sodium symporter family protein n=1 Tax=Endozoicomonas sp. OPT23 TaxID=2072845 RepID=UPI00129AD761|nr:bile acid:sodium symporter family protein [Endozoicomonas sp. OPT23]MRI31886.1 bile acid:sodium symporter [Endozoicomonas sp. OPT23]
MAADKPVLDKYRFIEHEISVALFPLFAIGLSLFSWQNPAYFQPLQDFIPAGLSLIMLTMGLTLSWHSFIALKSQLSAVVAGVCLQFMVMPVAGLLIAEITGLPENFMIGMILVGSVAGGTASNVLCYIAKASVALSIVMTSCTTLLGCFLTPLLIGLLTDTKIGVDTPAMMFSLMKIVLLPVSLGIFLNGLFHHRIGSLHAGLPLLSGVIIALTIATVVAINADTINAEAMAETGLALLSAVICHNLVGLTLGYQAARLLGHDKKTCKTIAIEVGVQNSGLAVVLAHKFFLSITALPAIFFSIWHNISGIILAIYWRRKSNSSSISKQG